MPVFDFQCKKCQTVFEHTRPFGSKEHPRCPACGSKRTEKLLTPPAIHFKGGGFYKTDSGAAFAKKTEPKKEVTTTEEPKNPPKTPDRKEAAETPKKSSQTPKEAIAH
ncbi:MAG: zinc ribbon domain-containing protein [Patescibacteria group bacterium]